MPHRSRQRPGSRADEVGTVGEALDYCRLRSFTPNYCLALVGSRRGKSNALGLKDTLSPIQSIVVEPQFLQAQLQPARRSEGQ